MNQQVNEQPAPSVEQPLQWTCQPARRQSGKAAGAAAAVVVCAVGAGWFTGEAFYGFFFFLILAVSVAPFYLPVQFTLDQRGVEKRYLGVAQRRPWSYFHSYYPDRNGVLLSPFARKAFLETYRGIYVRFEGNRESVLDYIKRSMVSV